MLNFTFQKLMNIINLNLLSKIKINLNLLSKIKINDEHY